MKATIAIVLFGALTAVSLGRPLPGSERNGVFRCGTIEDDSSSRHSRAATGYQNSLWDDAEVPFVFSDQVKASDVKREAVLEAMRHWEEKTCIRFKPRTQERDYVEITDDDSLGYHCDCCSSVGRVGGRQLLMLRILECFSFSTIVHELGHTIGFYHEVSRPDRDDYITVHNENILPEYLYAFDKLANESVKDLGVPYDYHSVMHYTEYAFSQNNRPTIEAKSDHSLYNGELSSCDCKEARLLYSCPNPAHDPPKMIPPNVVEPPQFPSSVSSDCQFRLKYTGDVSSASSFSGTFTSVNYAGHYPDNRECAWIIEGPVGFDIFILFDDVDLDSGDTVTVGTQTLSSSSPSLVAVTLYQHEATVLMKTDNVIGNGRGFRATYRFTDVNECALYGRYRCPNGACENYLGGFRCICADGMYSPEKNPYACIDINECCADNGGCSHQCINMFQSYKCTCPDDMILGADGKNCTRPAGCDKCSHECTVTSGSVVCQCPKGKTLDSDGVTCVDIQCGVGYQLSADGQTCEDYNECLVDKSNGCSHGCINTKGSYYCTCSEGFAMSKDGRSCEDVNECDGSHTCEHKCTNTYGSFKCECLQEGYRLGTDGTSCTDINECVEGIDNCNQMCHNNDGSYTCSCLSGYQLDSNGHTCSDVNECDGSHTCEHKCTNTYGSFKCECLQEGYRLGTDGTSCTEINECAEGIDNCNQMCHNTDGSYTCSCHSGYHLDSNGHTCSDINECKQGTHECSHECVNSMGSYQCTCPKGYVLSSNGKTCADVNECSSNSHGCSDICKNTLGSYHCECSKGYRLSPGGKKCDDIDECHEEDDLCPMGVCLNTAGSYSCSCPLGWQQHPSDGSCRPGGELICEGSLTIPVLESVSDAEWSVTTAEGKSLRVDLSGLGIGPTDNGRNYVELRNGRYNNSIVLAKFSGTGSAEFTPDTPEVYIVLHVEDPLSNGAVIEVTQEAGIAYSIHSGYKILVPGVTEMIGSDSFSELYGDIKTSYSMLVSFDSGYRMVVEFMYIDLPDGENDCSKNYIDVRDGLTTQFPLLGHMCGPTCTDKVQYSASGTFMRVDMVSNPTQPTRGFLAKAWLEQE